MALPNDGTGRLLERALVIVDGVDFRHLYRGNYAIPTETAIHYPAEVTRYREEYGHVTPIYIPSVNLEAFAPTRCIALPVNLDASRSTEPKTIFDMIDESFDDD